jgi:hypothetical protein
MDNLPIRNRFDYYFPGLTCNSLIIPQVKKAEQIGSESDSNTKVIDSTMQTTNILQSSMKSPSESIEQSSDTGQRETNSTYDADYTSSMGISRTSEFTEDSESSKYKDESASQRSKRKRKRKKKK